MRPDKPLHKELEYDPIKGDTSFFLFDQFQQQYYN
jgi:hypothetical protein